jgi:hypothetical protein
VSSGQREFEAFIAKIEQLGELNERVAAAAVEPVAGVVRSNIDRNVGPDGEPWPERQEGGKALRGASEALTASAKGNRITLSVGPPYAFHNWGAGGSSTTKKAESERRRTSARQAKSGTTSKFHAPKRQILPIAGEKLPEPIAEVLADTAKQIFDTTTKGDR